MRDLAMDWAAVNSHTFNRSGIEQMAVELLRAFSVLEGEARRSPMAPVTFIDKDGHPAEHALGDALIIQKRPQVENQVLLVCHMDTVYPADHHFQKVVDAGDGTVNGPGITDAKAGIVIMLKALQALEKSPDARGIGWTVIINADEEIGSPSSLPLFSEYAPRYQFGLVFEPCLDNGNLVGARKGSANFTLTAAGRSAHAGRSFADGRNAVDALARVIPQIGALSGRRKGLTVNVGIMRGGTATNVVPDQASASCNIRFLKADDVEYFREKASKSAAAAMKDTGVKIVMEGNVSAPPKLLEGKTLELFRHVQGCGRSLGVELGLEDSGGVCDGSRLQAAGLPVVDTLGARGGKIHSDGEFLLVNSLQQRAQLAALVLLQWASGEWDLK